MVPKPDQRHGYGSKHQVLFCRLVVTKQEEKPVIGQPMGQVRGRELRQITTRDTRYPAYLQSRRLEQYRVSKIGGGHLSRGHREITSGARRASGETGRVAADPQNGPEWLGQCATKTDRLHPTTHRHRSSCRSLSKTTIGECLMLRQSFGVYLFIFQMVIDQSVLCVSGYISNILLPV